MRYEGGLATLTSPEGQQRYASTFTCAHCGFLVHVKGGQRAEDVGGGCRQCLNVKNPLSGMICAKCVAIGTCTPFEKALERMERRAEYARLFECR